MPKQYPEEFRRQVIHCYQNGQSVGFLCQTHEIAHSTLYRWIREHQPIISADKIYSLSELNTIIRHKERAEHLLEIIRLSNIINDVPLRKRLEILVEPHSKFDKYSAHQLCEAMGVARGTFYNHIFRSVDRTKCLQEQETLMLQVQQIFDESGQRFGDEKIRVVLAEHDVRVSKKRIREIMMELDLESIRNNSKRNYKKRQAYQKQYHLKQGFSAAKINQIWVSDITYFKVKDYGIYLCVIIDMFSRRVVSYQVSRKSSTNLVTATFKIAFVERGNPTNLTFHSDRGGQYISDTFEMLLWKCGVRQSFSASRRPYDNAVAETFIATFKKEEAYRRDYLSEQDSRKSVDDYIQFYNERRPHKTLAYKAPIRFEALYGKDQERF